VLQVDGIFVEELPVDSCRLAPFANAEIQLVGREVVLELGNEGLVEALGWQSQGRILLFIGATHERTSSSWLFLLLGLGLRFSLGLLAGNRTLGFLFGGFLVFLREGAGSRTVAIKLGMVEGYLLAVNAITAPVVVAGEHAFYLGEHGSGCNNLKILWWIAL
jgi:hypothetical protein